MGCCFGKEKGTLAGAAGSRFAQLSPPPASAQHARLTGADPDGELSEGSPGDSSAQQRVTSYYGAEEDDVAGEDGAAEGDAEAGDLVEEERLHGVHEH